MKKTLFPFLKYLFGLGLVCLAAGASALLSPFLRGHYLFLFLAAVSISSLYGGFGVGVATALLAGALHDYFFQIPKYSFYISTSNDTLELVLFLGITFFISWAGARTRSAKRAAEEAVQAREDLIAIVSHDLKNPISAIKIKAAFMLKKNPLDKEAHSINTLADRMTRLIESILDLEKIHRGHVSLTFKSEKVNDILSDVRKMVEPQAEKKGIQLQVEAAPENMKVPCDRERCIQVFLNLLGNAIKFTPPKGLVTVKIKSSDKGIQFFVQDSGPGIAPEHLPRVFDRYWQAHGTEKQGTGLGLSIVKGIISAHKGKISVKSRLGQGTLFIFTLPL